MALIVEDGTGLSTAESYISTTDADTYIAAYKGANTTWDGATDATKEIAARQATQYIDGVYNWQGEIYSSGQALDWPRNYVYNDRGLMEVGIPTKLEQATAEVMFLIVTGVTITENVDRSKQTKREKVDVIEVEYEAGASQQPSFPEVNRLLSDLVINGDRVQRG